MKIDHNKKMVLFWSGIYSNFYHCSVRYEEKLFPSSEHVFMYLKARHFKDEEAMSAIQMAETPKLAKQIGRAVKGFDNVEWDSVKEYYMYEAVRAKFSQNTDLLHTAKVQSQNGTYTFVEASPLDNIWGIGLSEDDPRALNPEEWKGQNLLGKVLDKVIGELCSES